MKQILLAIAIFALIAQPKNSAAQTNNDVAFNYMLSLSGSVEAKVTSISIRAVRSFSREYKNVDDAKWFITKNGYAASFDSKGTNTKVVYDSKGNRLHSILSYTETNLSRDIRHLVKSNYYDATIIGVHQFEFNNNMTVYVIKMLDQQSKPMTLKVFNGEIEDITTHDTK